MHAVAFDPLRMALQHAPSQGWIMVLHWQPLMSESFNPSRVRRMADILNCRLGYKGMPWVEKSECWRSVVDVESWKWVLCHSDIWDHEDRKFEILFFKLDIHVRNRLTLIYLESFLSDGCVFDCVFFLMIRCFNQWPKEWLNDLNHGIMSLCNTQGLTLPFVVEKRGRFLSSTLKPWGIQCFYTNHYVCHPIP